MYYVDTKYQDNLWNIVHLVEILWTERSRWQRLRYRYGSCSDGHLLISACFV